MSVDRRCEECGAVLPANAPQGLCPGCLIQAQLVEPAPSPGIAEAAKGAFPAEPDHPPGATITLNLASEEVPGSVIGHYKLLEKVGEGGFGVVYVAEQREPVKRRVALKIIKLGMDTKQVVARFEAERQALALMDHPNIAKVLDAGATETGRPYFAMELVRGIRLTDYCDENNLPTSVRLELFIKVCQAIQHAHQKGIIHRDIKPSNILVTLHDGVPVPKVIDFGIAKATQGELTDKTVYTQLHQFIGTPAYMSPEQAEMSGLDIDTRSDIYSLGVLLYELLTGRTPFDQNRLVEAGLEGMRRIIREQEPVRPSTRVSSLKGEEGTTTAKHRGVDGPRLIHLLRGDLDWIAMKCLEKDRSHRFETANGLAMDVQRYLNTEPVVARPPSKLYRFQKLARRNRLTFTALACLASALLLGALVSTWQAVRASRAEAASRRQRDEATRAHQQAEAIIRFLTEQLLYQATPDQNAREKKVTMEEVLDRAARYLEQSDEIAGQPELEACLRLAVGSTYYRLGGESLAAADRHLRRAVALRRSALGPKHRDTLAAQQALAELLVFGSRNFREAEPLSRDTWQGQQELLGAENKDTLHSMGTYLVTLIEHRKLAEAESLARERLTICERVMGPDDGETIEAVGVIGYLLEARGDFVEAESYARDALSRYERTGKADTTDAFYALNNVALDMFLQGRLEQAEKLLVEGRNRAARVSGPTHGVTLHLGHVLARVLAEEGRLDEAETLARDTLAIRRSATPGHEGEGRTMLILGRVLVEKGVLDEAELRLQEALALFRQQYAMKPELAAQAQHWLGTIQLARQAYAEAEPLLLSNAELLLGKTSGLSANEQRGIVAHILRLYQAMEKPQSVASWQGRLEQIGQNQDKMKTGQKREP